MIIHVYYQTLHISFSINLTVLLWTLIIISRWGLPHYHQHGPKIKLMWWIISVQNSGDYTDQINAMLQNRTPCVWRRVMCESLKHRYFPPCLWMSLLAEVRGKCISNLFGINRAAIDLTYTLFRLCFESHNFFHCLMMASVIFYAIIAVTSTVSVAQEGGTCHACNCQFNNAELLNQLIESKIASGELATTFKFQ